MGEVCKSVRWSVWYFIFQPEFQCLVKIFASQSLRKMDVERVQRERIDAAINRI